MPVQMPISELKGLSVVVDDVVYHPGLETPEDAPHPFVYFITVHNRSKCEVVLKGRKWVLREDGSRQMRVLEGDGIVGSTPVLKPDDSFSYNSYHTIAADSEASGAFFGQIPDGTVVAARIPPFRMTIPRGV